MPKAFRAWVIANPPREPDTYETDTLPEAYEALAEGLSVYEDERRYPVLVGGVERYDEGLDWTELNGDEEGYREDDE